MAGAVIGAAIGWGVGGTVAAAAIGFSVGRAYDNYKEQKEMMESINQSPTYSFGPIRNTKSHEMPIPIIYGKNLVAGNIINQKVRGENDRYMDLQVGISEGPIEAITEVKANENPISPNIQLGKRNQTAWGQNNHGQTFPYVAHYNATLDAKKLEISSTPTLTAIVKGRKVRVWDGNKFVIEYSNNNAWCLLDFLTHKRYGLGIDDNEIDLDSFKEVAEYCDSMVDGEKRFELDMVIDSKKSALDIITEILSTFRSFLFYSDGKLKLKVDRAEAAVQSFDMDNIIAESFAYNKTSRKERLKEVTVEYTEPDENYERISARYTDESYTSKAKRTITLIGVNRFSQAGRIARYFQKKSKYCTTQATWGAGIGDIQAEVGDVVLLSHEVPEWVDKPFRIVEIKEKENDEMQITGIEYNEAIYNDDGVVYQPSTGSTLPNPFAPPASVSNLSLLEQANVLEDGSWIPQIKVTFEQPSSMFWKYANIYYSVDNGATWEFHEKTELTQSIIKELAPGTYKVRVQSENNRGRKEDFGLANTGQITVNGKDAPPSNVNWGNCEFQHNVILRWQPITDIDLKAYEVRTDQNFGNDDSSLVYRGNGLETTINSPDRRQYTFYVKAIDRSGNYSELADEITLVNSAPPAPNFSEDDVTEWFSAIKIAIPIVSAADGYKVYITPSDGEGNPTGETTIHQFSAAQDYYYPVQTGDSILIKIGAYDNLTQLLDDENISAEIEATAATIDDIAQFASDLRPPQIVDVLPKLPDTNYPVDSSVVYDGRLYINENGSWVSKVNEAETAVNALIAGTVEAGAIGTEELASAEAIIEKLGANQLIAYESQIKNAIIDDAKIINVSAKKILSEEMLADLIVSRGSIVIKGNEKEAVDSLAMMATSQKDYQVTNEWDAWKMDQDAIQGYDSDGNKQTKLTNEGKIKLTEDNGDYSLLDSQGLAFYKSGSITPHWYSRRVAYGTAQDGDYIELNWDKKPKVITSIKSLMSYHNDYSQYNQIYESFAESISSGGFYARGISTILGEINDLDNNFRHNIPGYNTPSTITHTKTYTSPTTLNNATNLMFDVNISALAHRIGGANHLAIDYNAEIKIKYQKGNETPVLHDTQTTSGNIFEDHLYSSGYRRTLLSTSVNIAGLPPSTYKIIVEFKLTARPYYRSDAVYRAYFDVSSIQTANSVVVDNGEVSWIAIEGGAE